MFWWHLNSFAATYGGFVLDLLNYPSCQLIVYYFATHLSNYQLDCTIKRVSFAVQPLSFDQTLSSSKADGLPAIHLKITTPSNVKSAKYYTVDPDLAMYAKALISPTPFQTIIKLTSEHGLPTSGIQHCSLLAFAGLEHEIQLILSRTSPSPFAYAPPETILEEVRISLSVSSTPPSNLLFSLIVVTSRLKGFPLPSVCFPLNYYTTLTPTLLSLFFLCTSWKRTFVWGYNGAYQCTHCNVTSEGNPIKVWTLYYLYIIER